MKIYHRTIGVFLSGALMALVLSAVLASSAGASPGWDLDGTPLAGSETVLGDAIESTLTIPGLTTTCDYHYKMTISNSAGSAIGKIIELLISNCSTNSPACKVKTIAAEALPWSLIAKTSGSNNYIVIKGIKVALVLTGKECALNGLLITVTGSAGGRFDNATNTFTFDSASFSATGTQVTALGSPIEWKGVFSTETLSGQELTLL